MTILKTAGAAAVDLLTSHTSVGQAALRMVYVGLAIVCAASAIGHLSRSEACQEAEFNLERPKGGAAPMVDGSFAAAQDRVTGICVGSAR